jgi:hypothetical protein
MRWIALVLGLAAVPVAADNLLANPGFEQLDGDLPARWRVFVAPQEGAEGRVDNLNPYEGRYCVLLHNPEPYEEEPANNWSQNIIADLTGKTLLVTGAIRTDDATEVALWLQCFRRQPWAVTRFATTSTDSPIYGTRDWTPVEMRVEVPAQTDFVVLRCVLKGRGTAWFDSVCVEDGTQPPDERERKAMKDAAAAFGPPEKLEGPEGTEVRKALLDAHQAMVETNQTLRDMNRELAEQIKALQQDLRDLRAQIDARKGAPPAKQEATAAAEAAPTHSVAPVAVGSGRAPKVTPPPLVPHGYDWERLLE